MQVVCACVFGGGHIDPDKEYNWEESFGYDATHLKTFFGIATWDGHLCKVKNSFYPNYA